MKMTGKELYIKMGVVFMFAAAMATRGADLEFGGVTFRLPEKGGGVCVVEGGKATRLFHTNLGYSDEAGRKMMAVEWKKPNRIAKLRNRVLLVQGQSRRRQPRPTLTIRRLAPCERLA